MRLTIRKILVSLNPGSTADRRQRIGILRYAAKVGNWDFVFGPNHRMPGGDTVSSDISAGYDGVISSSGLKDWKLHDIVTRQNVPFVLIDTDRATVDDAGKRRIGFVASDDYRAGQMGAQHLLSLGKMRSYGFIPSLNKNSRWSSLRQQGMADVLGRHGLELKVFDSDSCSLAEWLAALPKPTAIMTASDDGANQAISICHKIKVQIPDQLVIIGNDNDEIICENLRPRLSSIRIDHESEGYAAAKMLDRMMRYPKRPVKDVLIAPKGVAVRESTRPVSPAANLIERALAYIQEHAADGITVDDVVDHVNVSRCLLYLRFREQLGKSILAAITERRVAMLKAKLKTSAAPVAQLALACGFPTAGHATRVFRAATGVSPRDWRTKACSSKDSKNARSPAKKARTRVEWWTAHLP